MASLSLKSFFLWFSNTLLPFVLFLNLPEKLKDDLRDKVDIFTSNAQFLYFVLLSAWVIFNFINLWFKYRNVVLENKALELENKIKEEQLKQLRDKNTRLDNRE